VQHRTVPGRFDERDGAHGRFRAAAHQRKIARMERRVH
jgi:hypothetical protein